MPGLHELRFAWRRLTRDRGQTMVAVLLLALGVSATIVMADMLDRLLLRPPVGVSAPERVVRIYEAGGHPNPLTTNYAIVTRLSEGTRDEFEAWACYLNEALSLGRGADARRVQVVSHSEAYFDVLGVTPQLGTLPTAKRASAAADTAVISHSLWQRRFGGLANVIGQPLPIGRRVYTIAAVTPRGFAGIDTDPVDVWIPLDDRALLRFGPEWRTSVNTYYWLPAIARLRPGIDRLRAADRATTAFNATIIGNANRMEQHLLLGDVLPARAPGGGPVIRVAEWVAAMSSIVLLLACLNVGNLLLMRGMGRSTETAIKLALGASRSLLAREVLIDALLLAVLASGVALFVVIIAGDLVRTLILPPVLATVAPLDARLIALAMLVCLIAAFMLGMVPALRVTSGATLRPGLASRPDRPSRLLDVFAGLQVVLSVPLIAGAGLFVMSLWHAREQNFGIQSSHLVVIETNTAEIGKPDDNHLAHRRIQERLARLPEVQSAVVVTSIPMGDEWFATGLMVGTRVLTPFANEVDPAFFDAMGMRLVEGRNFTTAENQAKAKPVMIVNQSLAQQLWPGESPIGHCAKVGFDINGPCVEVVGVVGNSAMWAGEWQPSATPGTFYIPVERFRDNTARRALLVRTHGDPTQAIPTLRREALNAGVASLPYIDVWTFDDVFMPMLRPWRLGATMFAAFGALSLLIASAGLAVVTAYGVARRRRELGVRLVLGADPRTLVWLMLRRSAINIIGGLAIGIVLAVAGQRWLMTMLTGLVPQSIEIFGLTAVVLLAVGGLAVWIPASRAAHVDPGITLRAE
jgi:putative ABC transport system permease protein